MKNYPEISTASMSGPEATGSVLHYSFKPGHRHERMNHSSKMTTAADLLALFAAKATAPPSESSQMLVRHSQCKESLIAAHCLTEAMDRYTVSDGHPLPAPTDYRDRSSG